MTRAENFQIKATAKTEIQSVMAGDNSNEADDINCSFQWDENSQLYYHASSGFYHDPQAGWYYSSTDGQYYKFEDGSYVLLDSNHMVDDQSEMLNTSCQERPEVEMEVGEIPVASSEETEPGACNSTNQSEYPPPPSEWLEDTLIEMYLSGYPSQATDAAPLDSEMPVEANEAEKIAASAQGEDDFEELEEGEWIPDDPQFLSNLTEDNMDEGISQEEENWRAQYGQVCQLEEDWMSGLQVVDLWDWALVRGTKKDGKTEVSKLVGRLTKPSSRTHPSVPTGGCKLRTAPVCEVHLDMVRVTSGKIYRLRVPSLQYLACSPLYDASNPTKDWGFPQLSIENSQPKKLPKYDSLSESQTLDASAHVEKSQSSKKLSLLKKDHMYRDRAAERRALHGGFGVGPGQKKSLNGADSAPTSPTSLHAEDAAAESLNISFGEGSYARKIMESMGWKQGEALGGSMKGLTEPLQAVGNKGNAGLGFDDGRRRK